MNKSNKITDSEWEVMEVFWEHGECRASEVIHTLRSISSWSDKTIRTLIDRLVNKDVLGVKRENVNIYYPRVSKDECVREVTESFIQKVYNGSLGLLVANFTKNNSLSQEDISVLKSLLNDKDSKES